MRTYIEGIEYLKSLTSNALLPLIGKRCALYDVPFYKNIGDVLIWQGELSFLENNGIQIVDFADYHTYKFKKLPEDVTILFQGGGNTGDLYHEHTELLLKLVKDFTNNSIVVFSQTVYYKNKELLMHDFDLMANHGNLYFCARDVTSYNTIVRFLGDHALILPDMAFCIDLKYLNQWQRPSTFSSLYIRRNDIEAKFREIEGTFDTVTDWPCFEKKIMLSNLGNTIFDRAFKYLPFIRKALLEPWKKYAYSRFRPLMIKDGVEFISSYKHVVSERLHGCILSILLGKKVTVVNNSYGKNKNFYEAWLTDFDNVKLLESD